VLEVKWKVNLSVNLTIDDGTRVYVCSPLVILYCYHHYTLGCVEESVAFIYDTKLIDTD